VAGKRINHAPVICLDFVNILQFSIERHHGSARLFRDPQRLLRRS
jgi:hypothetical protein